MLAILALILLVIWVVGLALHLLGGFIHLFLVAAVIVALAHFIRSGSNSSAIRQ